MVTALDSAADGASEEVVSPIRTLLVARSCLTTHLGVVAGRTVSGEVGIGPHPQASTAHSGLVLAAESFPSPPRQPPWWGLVGLDRLRVGGPSAPVAWCCAVRRPRHAWMQLLLRRCHGTQRTPRGVGSRIPIRWSSDATVRASAEASMPTTPYSAAVAEPPAWRRAGTTAVALANDSLMRMPMKCLEVDALLPRPWRLVVLTIAAGHAPRLRAFAGSPRESALAAEPSASPLRRGLLALDRASGRGAAVPALGCRAARVAAVAGAPLLRCSLHGSPMLPSRSGWRLPTRMSSVALPLPRALGGWPAHLASPPAAALCA